jgi:hypothetical protein
VVKVLESLFPGWMFAAVDARGRSGGWLLGGLKRLVTWKVFGVLIQELVCLFSPLTGAKCDNYQCLWALPR